MLSGCGRLGFYGLLKAFGQARLLRYRRGTLTLNPKPGLGVYEKKCSSELGGDSLLACPSPPPARCKTR